jgi:SAM-dependent methyltransferase
MPGSRRPTLSRTGLAYGEEYPLDDVDTYVNGILLERYAERTSSLPRVALNLGCRTGLRAFSLAQLEVLGRPLFDEIIAQDLIDYGTDIAVRNTGKVPIRFRQQDVAALDAAAFEGIEVVYVDFRRVGHFLSPFHFRKALRTIGNIVADDGLVTVTFDGIRPRLGFLLCPPPGHGRPLKPGCLQPLQLLERPKLYDRTRVPANESPHRIAPL